MHISNFSAPGPVQRMYHNNILNLLSLKFLIHCKSFCGSFNVLLLDLKKTNCVLLFYVLGKTKFFTVPITKRWCIFCLGIQIYWCLYQSKNSQDITIYINAQLSITNELKDNLSCSLGLINHENSYTILGVRISLLTKLKLCDEDQILGILFVFQGAPLATAHWGNTNYP